VFLPQRYTAVFKDDDVLAINDGFAVWHLVSKGRCRNSNEYQLAIEYTHFAFQMDFSSAKVNIEIPDFLSSDNMWTLPENLKNVSQCMLEANPLGNCHMKTEWPYLIHEIRRVGHDVIFCIGCPRGRKYRLPEEYAKAVSDDDIRTVNSYRTLYAVIKRELDDGSGIADVVIE